MLLIKEKIFIYCYGEPIIRCHLIEIYIDIIYFYLTLYLISGIEFCS